MARYLSSLMVVALLTPAPAGGAEIVLPRDPRAVIDVRADCGAKGDGTADDTAALQTAIERSSSENRCVYLPNGTYRVTATLVFKPPGRTGEGSMVGPWLIGQDRERTVIRLADGAEGFGDPAKPREMVRGQDRPDGARMNADFFDRTVVNLTLDAGDNPGAVGFKFYSNNTGELRRVTIRGNGACGLDLGFNDQNGPLLVQDVAIDGFAVGVRTDHLLNAQTLSRVTVRNAREVGLLHRGQVMAAEGLNVARTSPAIDSGGNGVLALVDCRLEAPAADATGPAVRADKATVYAARLATSGFARAVGAKDVTGSADESTVGRVETLGDGAPGTGLALVPEAEPDVPYPTSADEWVCANDFGAQAGDDADDAPAFQRAIDEAARKGATTVYILPGKRGDPNWYVMKQDVRVHGSVRRVTGLGFVRVFGGSSGDARFPENLAKFVVDADPAGAKVVAFEHLQVFAPSPSFGIEARSPGRTVVCRATGGAVIARPQTTVFLSNCVGHCYQEAGTKVWMRQWNTEGSPAKLGVNTRNDGGQLWILGMKTEGKSTMVLTSGGGRTEVIGVHNYNTRGVRDETPYFKVVGDGSALSVAAYREICFRGGDDWWKVPVLMNAGDKEYRSPSRPWNAWALLRAGK